MTPLQPPLANMITWACRISLGNATSTSIWAGQSSSTQTTSWSRLRGTVLMLFPREQLARDAHARRHTPATGSR